MRHHPNMRTERFRVACSESPEEGGITGIYNVPINGTTLAVIASDGLGFDHVSVSVLRVRRCPTWEEMETIRHLFFRDDEVVIQYSPPRDKIINVQQYTLHLWRSQSWTVPLPPSELV